MHAAVRPEPGSRSSLYMLVLSGLTATLVVAAPTMAMPVLFSELAESLGLTLVQIGAVWGLASFAGLFASLAGGIIGDRFGTKRTLIVSCLLLGVAGASRGLSNSLFSLSVTVLLTGALTAVIPILLHKVCSLWFTGRRLGMANAVVSGGMALGFMLSSLVSATLLSPKAATTSLRPGNVSSGTIALLPPSSPTISTTFATAADASATRSTFMPACVARSMNVATRPSPVRH